MRTNIFYIFAITTCLCFPHTIFSSEQPLTKCQQSFIEKLERYQTRSHKVTLDQLDVLEKNIARNFPSPQKRHLIQETRCIKIDRLFTMLSDHKPILPLNICDLRKYI